jgi:CelD/BcsL family acetyltransferase involved in cellulose biosynthesis
MQFTKHKDFAEIPVDAWNALVASGISDTPFARREYLQQWWHTLGGGEWDQADLVLISAAEKGQTVGIAPLFLAQHDGEDALLLVGSIEISDYLDLIVPSGSLPEFLTGLLDFIVDAPELRGLPLDWYNVPDSSPTLPALRAECERRGWLYREQVYRPTPRIALSGDFETYLGGLEKKQRHEIRRKMRRAAESLLPVQFYLVEEAAALEAEMDAFFELMAVDIHKAQFLKPAMREHMRSIMRTAFRGGYLSLAFLTVEGTKAAAALNFDYKNKIWGYNSGVSQEFTELSPGWVLLAHQLRWACEHGRYEYDFMRGDEEYKYRFGAIDRHVMRVRIVPA